MNIVDIKLKLLDLFADPGKVTIHTPDYRSFHEMLMKLASKYNLVGAEEWQEIERNLIHKDSEWLSMGEATEIKFALDRISLRPEIRDVAESSDIDEIAFLHPTVLEVARSRFNSGHYADAVESVFKDINCRVKKRVLELGGEERDGTKLMQLAFGGDKPLLRVVPSRESISNRDIQAGYQFMFAGAMSAIRNPQAHDNLTMSKARAVRLLMFASDLMEKLDAAVQ